MGKTTPGRPAPRPMRPGAAAEADQVLTQLLRVGAPESTLRDALARMLELEHSEAPNPNVSTRQMREWALHDLPSPQLARLRRFALISEDQAGAPPVSSHLDVTDAELEAMLPHRLDEARWRAAVGLRLAPDLRVDTLEEFGALALAVEQVPQMLAAEPPPGPRRLLLGTTPTVLGEFLVAARARFAGQGRALSAWIERRPETTGPGDQRVVLCVGLESALTRGDITSCGVWCDLGAATAADREEDVRALAEAAVREEGLDIALGAAQVRLGEGSALSRFDGVRPPAGGLRDLAELLGVQPCEHPQITEQPNAPGDALVIGCRRCRRERLAVVPAHRLPYGHPLLERALEDPDGYVAAERRYAAVAGDLTDQPLTMEGLRDRDGAIDPARIFRARHLRPRSLAEALERRRR